MAAVFILMGSASDKEKVLPCLEVLGSLQIGCEAAVSSAHRSQERTRELVAQAEKAGAQVFICAAGMAAHLAGAVAALTARPVIGVPLSGGALQGLDALLSTVQMPSGFPVATVALDGARNAAWLAAQILALGDAALADRIDAARRKMREGVEAASLALQKELKELSFFKC